MFAIIRVGILLIAILPVAAAPADDQPRQGRYRITGLFSPARAADLREAFERLPEVKLIAVDYENAEATVEYVPAKAFPGAKNPDEVVKQFDSRLRSVCYGTFGVRPLSGTP